MSISGQFIDTGDRGLAYLRHQLGYGGLLAKLLLNVPLEQGRVVTKGFSTSDLPLDFDSDLDPGVSKLQWDFAIEIILDFLRQPSDPVAVFEHPFFNSRREIVDV
jgi:hypothetical protein